MSSFSCDRLFGLVKNFKLRSRTCLIDENLEGACESKQQDVKPDTGRLLNKNESITSLLAVFKERIE
jgi:hypothetical protein